MGTVKLGNLHLKVELVVGHPLEIELGFHSLKGLQIAMMDYCLSRFFIYPNLWTGVRFLLDIIIRLQAYFYQKMPLSLSRLDNSLNRVIKGSGDETVHKSIK